MIFNIFYHVLPFKKRVNLKKIRVNLKKIRVNLKKIRVNLKKIRVNTVEVFDIIVFLPRSN